MLKKIFVTLIALIAAILIYATTRPNTFRVERSIVITAPPEKVFALIDDFHNWDSWSPWAHLDPNMKATYSGAPNGKGAIYSWEGNRKVGAGRMEIVDDPKPTHIGIQVDFLKPMQASNPTTFDFSPEGNTTHVTWVTTGDMKYINKVMCVFMSMDKMIGKDFEKGLQQLKAQAEK